jgi:hypothetical protein
MLDFFPIIPHNRCSWKSARKSKKIIEKSLRKCLTSVSNFGKIEYQQKLVLEK